MSTTHKHIAEGLIHSGGGTYVKLGGLFLAGCLLSTSALALNLGVNIHEQTDPAIADLMKTRNLKNARMDLTAYSDKSSIRDQVQRITANGGRVEVSLQNSYEWDHSCNSDLASVEQQSYSETMAIVNDYKDVIFDYELLNEVTLRPETLAEVPFNSAGTSTSPYQGKACYQTMAAVLRGMSHAILDVKSESGYPLRIILGAVGRDFGFLTFMQQQGVAYDVVGYHIYPTYQQASMLTDTWFGPGGLFTQLALFNRPVHINEFDCGEIYNTSYDNQPDSAETYNCFKSYIKHIPDMFSQSQANVESIIVYELLDDPSKSGAESRFGLMYSMDQPKAHLSILTAYAGGALTTVELELVTSLGVLTVAEIDAYKNESKRATFATYIRNLKASARYNSRRRRL